jgi:hypothetical protein
VIAVMIFLREPLLSNAHGLETIHEFARNDDKSGNDI